MTIFILIVYFIVMIGIGPWFTAFKFAATLESGTKLIRSLAAVAVLVGLGGSLVAQFKATGEIFSELLGTSYVVSLFIGVSIVGIYSTVGCYLATVRATFGTFSIGFLSEMNAKLADIAPTMFEIDGGGKMPITMIVVM